jgi:hypothetical protein
MVNAKADTVRWPSDSTRIDVRDQSEVEFWSWRLHVSAGKLKHAVRSVGPRLKDVSDHLSFRRS